MENKKLSIIVPCYNERETIQNILNRLTALVLPAGWGKEVIVVDDASTDGTRDIIRRFEDRMRTVYCEKNGGKGSAVRRGLAEASGTHVLLQDADLEYDPEEIPSLIGALAHAEVVYGSRNLRPRERPGAYVPRAGVWFITKLINALYGLSLTDAWTCYKLFPREAAGDFAAGRFESELLFTAALKRRGYRFAEVPISYHPREFAEGKKIRYRDGILAIIVIMQDWIRHRKAP